MNAYTYLIGWSKHQKFYYGAQWNKKANPEDLWASYHTSSTGVKKFREQFGEPDVVEIRQVFGEDATACRVWEERVLTRVRKTSPGKWLNRSAGSAKWFSPSGMVHAIDTKNNTGVYVTREEYATNTELKHVLSGRTGQMKEETIRKMSSAKKGKNLSPYHSSRISESLKGRNVYHSKETRFKISETLKGTVAVVNIITGERYRVTREEFKNNPELKGTRYRFLSKE